MKLITNLLTRWNDYLDDEYIDTPITKALATMFLLFLGVPAVFMAALLLIIVWPLGLFTLTLVGLIWGFKRVFERLDE